MANLHFYGQEYGDGEKGLFMGPGFFLGRLVQLRKGPVAPGKPADGERYGGGVWVFQVIGIAVHFLHGTGGITGALAMLFPAQE
jgi:hypothetical protein